MIISGGLLALLVGVTFFLPLFFNYQSINNQNKHNNQVDAKDFFTQRYVTEKVGTRFPVSHNIRYEQ